MLSPEDTVRLRHMLEAAEKAVSFTENRTQTELDANEQLTLALTRLLEIVGEACRWYACKGSPGAVIPHPAEPFRVDHLWTTP